MKYLRAIISKGELKFMLQNLCKISRTTHNVKTLFLDKMLIITTTYVVSIPEDPGGEDAQAILDGLKQGFAGGRGRVHAPRPVGPCRCNFVLRGNCDGFSHESFALTECLIIIFFFSK